MVGKIISYIIGHTFTISILELREWITNQSMSGSFIEIVNAEMFCIILLHWQILKNFHINIKLCIINQSIPESFIEIVMKIPNVLCKRYYLGSE